MIIKFVYIQSYPITCPYSQRFWLSWRATCHLCWKAQNSSLIDNLHGQWPKQLCPLLLRSLWCGEIGGLSPTWSPTLVERPPLVSLNPTGKFSLKNNLLFVSQMNEWINEWMKKWMNEWMNEERMNKVINERINGWINEWMKKRMNELTNEWRHE
jgi:hypothetical protein